MSILTRVFGWLYIQSLRLYPREFQAEFSDEMQAVFASAAKDACYNFLRLLVLFGRELRDWPSSLLREHWSAQRYKEIQMTFNIKRPDWFFYPGWVGASIFAFALAFLAYFPVISLVERWVGDIIYVNGVRHITEDYLFEYFFFPIFCLISGILQYVLLRLYLPKMGGWILATLAGCLLVFATMTLLTRIFELSIRTFWNGALVFAIIGGLIGLSQWVFLRRRIPKAGWWILASFLGWGLAVLGSLTSMKNASTLAQILTFSLSPAIVAGFAWWFLLRPKSQLENPLSG